MVKRSVNYEKYIVASTGVPSRDVPQNAQYLDCVFRQVEKARRRSGRGEVPSKHHMWHSPASSSYAEYAPRVSRAKRCMCTLHVPFCYLYIRAEVEDLRGGWSAVTSALIMEHFIGYRGSSMDLCHV